MEEERLEAAALLWHESSWASDKALLRKKSMSSLTALVSPTDSASTTGLTLGAALQPVCDDVRTCLHDDIRSLRSLLLNTAWLLKTSSSSTVAPVSGADGSAERSEGELALMHLMYKISDARSLANSRIDLASGREGCPPPLVLDLWSDTISHGISLVAEARFAGKYKSGGMSLQAYSV